MVYFCLQVVPDETADKTPAAVPHNPIWISTFDHPSVATEPTGISVHLTDDNEDKLNATRHAIVSQGLIHFVSIGDNAPANVQHLSLKREGDQ